MSTQVDEVKEYGWTAVPHSLSAILANRPDPASKSTPLTTENIGLPETELAKQVLEYARAELPKQTFNHSMRVYYFGRAIAIQHLPQFSHSPETLLVVALLHDIGTTPANLTSTHLSFEFSGAMTAFSVLSALPSPAPKAQRDSVAETIIRHQDLGDIGSMTELTAIIHFATIFDNAGANAGLVHKDTIEAVVKAHPREGWTGCFADVLRKEIGAKPWSNSTRVDGFVAMVEGNELMRPYD